MSQQEIPIPQTEDKTGVQEWVILQPTKCNKIPWRNAWAEENNQPYESFPLENELDYLKEYYSQKGVIILDATLTYSIQEKACNGCGCPEPFVFAVFVYQKDAAKLAVSGFEILDKGDPNIFTSPLFRQSTQQKDTPPSVSDCEKVFSTTTFLDVLFGSARDSCYIQVAFSQQDETICEKVLSPKGRNDCYTEVAVLKKNVILCQKVEDKQRQQGCIAQVASATQNKELCTVLTDESAKQYCEIVTQTF